MLFCCIWRNVETSCHKYFVVVSRHQQTPPLTSLPAIGVTTCGIVVRQRRVDNTWLAVALTARGEARYWLRIAISAYPTCIRLGELPSKYCHDVWYRKTRMAWLPDGEKNWRYVYSFWQNSRTWQTDRRMDTGTPHDDIGRACIASRKQKGINIAAINLEAHGGTCIVLFSNRSHALCSFSDMAHAV